MSSECAKKRVLLHSVVFIFWISVWLCSVVFSFLYFALSVWFQCHFQCFCCTASHSYVWIPLYVFGYSVLFFCMCCLFDCAASYSLRVQRELCEDDEFLILACDGVWDVLSNQDAVDCVRDYKPDIAAQMLVDLAFDVGSTDNISAVVVFFQELHPEPEAENEVQEGE